MGQCVNMDHDKMLWAREWLGIWNMDRDTESLRAQIEELERENEALKRNIFELQGRLTVLHRQLARPPTAAPGSPPAMKHSSRGVLLRWLRRLDKLVFGGKP